MTYVLFVPGLNGHKSIPVQTSQPQPGTNYYAVATVARDLSVPCYRAVFQTASNPFPTLSEMGLEVASQIRAVTDAHGEPGLIVASSIGAGVTMQALTELEHERNLPHVIAFKPVFDPLDAITGALAKVPEGQICLDKLKSSELSGLPLPVESTYASQNPGHFMLTQAHIDDTDALRLISDSTTSFAHFSEKLGGRKMASMKILVAENDTVSQNMTAFIIAARQHAKDGCSISLIPGNHADDQSKRLAGEVHKRLWEMQR